MTITGATIRHFAAGIRYLVGRGVTRIRVGTRLTPDPDWRPGRLSELERQVGEVVELSVTHWKRAGEVPVAFLAGAPGPARYEPGDGPACGAPLGRSTCVDSGGTVWGCPLFASSLQKLPPLARQAARAVRFGSIGDAGLEARLDGRPRRIPRAFTHKPAKRSSYGRCRDCELLSECVVCPAAICLAGDTADPDVIPDFQCAYNRVVFAARRRFAERTAGGAGRAQMDAVKAALRGVRDALARSLPTEQRAVPPGLREAP